MFAAVLANETGSYGYADLDAIARNAILQCRDMYLRPEYYAEKENAVIVLISDLINEVEIGATDYKTAEKQAYTRIYQTAEPTASSWRTLRTSTPIPTAWATSAIGICPR